MSVENRLGLARRTRRVQHEKWIFGIHHFGFAPVAPTRRTRNGQRHQIVIPVISAGFHRDVLTGALEDNDVFDRAGARDGLIEDALKLDHLAVHEAAVAGDGDVGLAVLNPTMQRLDEKPP